MTEIQPLIDLLASRSARRGEFTLASGRHSTLYIDARLTTMSPEGLSIIGPTGLHAIRASGWEPDAVGGMTLGADPIAYAISYASASTRSPLRAFTIRKEPKSHGTKQLIEGPFRSGDRIIIVEDVITTGASAIRAMDVAREAGATVLGVLALVDREEGGREALEQHVSKVVALTRASDIIAAMPTNQGRTEARGDQS